MSIQTDLTPAQMCRAWIANRIKDVDQQTITELMGITNSGRVSEAITMLDYAMENADMIYQMAREAKAKKNGAQ